MGLWALTSWGLLVKSVTVVLDDDTVSFASSAHAPMSSKAAVRRASSSAGEEADSRRLKSSANDVVMSAVWGQKLT